MKSTLILISLATVLALVGCTKNGEPIGAGVGDSSVSGGTGGDGSGPTGTQGSEPADNPAADSPKSNGTGTD